VNSTRCGEWPRGRARGAPIWPDFGLHERRDHSRLRTWPNHRRIFPADLPAGYFDLDHDQRLSGLANLNYMKGNFSLSVTEIYGSGLTNGADPDASYSTGLFAFNKSIKVRRILSPTRALGLPCRWDRRRCGWSCSWTTSLTASICLKGAFFSGASVGRPRSIQLRANWECSYARSSTDRAGNPRAGHAARCRTRESSGAQPPCCFPALDDAPLIPAISPRRGLRMSRPGLAFVALCGFGQR